jgi:hypothetical protein
LTASLLQVLATAPSGAWDAFNLAPSSRTVYATTIHGTSGNVTGAANLLSTSGIAVLSGDGSYVTLDFGKEVCNLLYILNNIFDTNASRLEG